MTSTPGRRTFRRDNKTWSVARCTGSPSRHETGLQFRHESESRFLVFTRGTMPSDSELRTMSDEVLRVLLARAVARTEDSRRGRGGAP